MEGRLAAVGTEPCLKEALAKLIKKEERYIRFRLAPSHRDNHQLPHPGTGRDRTERERNVRRSLYWLSRVPSLHDFASRDLRSGGGHPRGKKKDGFSLVVSLPATANCLATGGRWEEKPYEPSSPHPPGVVTAALSLLSPPPPRCRRQSGLGVQGGEKGSLSATYPYPAPLRPCVMAGATRRLSLAPGFP